MTVNHVVVDGSNLATEGRTLPSLNQLDEAVRAFIDEYKPKTVTVVVDASFPNRIDDAERATFEEAVEAGEIISPPAGVIGRGDAFVLQIADRADAVVLSNDSFQEFHGQYAWLFDEGRLVGGKPVPHVGWVFMDRSPVRGPLSRRSVSEAKKAGKATKATKATKASRGSTKRAKQAAGPEPRAPKADAGSAKGGDSTGKGRSRRRGGAARGAGVDAAQASGASMATKSAADAAAPRKRRSGASSGGLEPYNEALPFIEFVGAHPVGSIVEGEVERFSSHGAYVVANGARCYLPLKHLADPPPRSAREVLNSGERYEFVVHAFDTPRRGVDLAIPGVVPIPAQQPAEVEAASDPVPDQPEEERVAPAKKAKGKKAPAKKKKAAAKKAPARKTAAKKTAARKTTAKKAPAKKRAAKKRTAKKAPAKKKSTAKKSSAKKATRKKAPAKKRAAKKRTAKKAPAKRAAKKR